MSCGAMATAVGAATNVNNIAIPQLNVVIYNRRRQQRQQAETLTDQHLHVHQQPAEKTAEMTAHDRRINELDHHVERIFDVRKRLGKGAYGIVWKATDKRLKETVALKKIFDAFRDETDAQRTYREVVFLRAFRHHPNIIRMLDVYKAANDLDFYLVFEYMESDLHNVIKKGGILKDIHKRFVMYQLINAIKYMHSGNVIHRDLKPSNILIDSKCRLKVADFGLARTLSAKRRSQDYDSKDELENEAVLTDYVATRWYRAPEILVASRKYTKGIDMWSLGCILGEMIRQKPLFQGTSTVNQIEKIVNALPEVTQRDIDSIGAGFGSVLLSRKIVRDRHCSLEEMLRNSCDDAMSLVKSLLVLDPDGRLTAKAAIAHSYVHRFRSPSAELDMRTEVSPPLQDDVRFTVEQYRCSLYELSHSDERLTSLSRRSSSVTRASLSSSTLVHNSGVVTAYNSERSSVPALGHNDSSQNSSHAWSEQQNPQHYPQATRSTALPEEPQQPPVVLERELAAVAATVPRSSTSLWQAPVSTAAAAAAAPPPPPPPPQGQSPMLHRTALEWQQQLQQQQMQQQQLHQQQLQQKQMQYYQMQQRPQVMPQPQPCGCYMPPPQQQPPPQCLNPHYAMHGEHGQRYSPREAAAPNLADVPLPADQAATTATKPQTHIRHKHGYSKRSASSKQAQRQREREMAAQHPPSEPQQLPEQRHHTKQPSRRKKSPQVVQQQQEQLQLQLLAEQEELLRQRQKRVEHQKQHAELELAMQRLQLQQQHKKQTDTALQRRQRDQQESQVEPQQMQRLVIDTSQSALPLLNPELKLGHDKEPQEQLQMAGGYYDAQRAVGGMDAQLDSACYKTRISYLESEMAKCKKQLVNYVQDNQILLSHRGLRYHLRQLQHAHDLIQPAPEPEEPKVRKPRAGNNADQSKQDKPPFFNGLNNRQSFQRFKVRQEKQSKQHYQGYVTRGQTDFNLSKLCSMYKAKAQQEKAMRREIELAQKREHERQLGGETEDYLDTGRARRPSVPSLIGDGMQMQHGSYMFDGEAQAQLPHAADVIYSPHAAQKRNYDNFWHADAPMPPAQMPQSVEPHHHSDAQHNHNGNWRRGAYQGPMPPRMSAHPAYQRMRPEDIQEACFY